MFFFQDKIFKLKGKVQHYAWGGDQFIPQWLGTENTEHRPYAEYWMGAHPSASSLIITKGGNLPLYKMILDYPYEFIGGKVFSQFGELPYLFKILDVKEMLSIQVHPTKEAAAKGFDEEDAAGIAIGSTVRNYKDKNHKPEVMVALSECWLLHGFRQKKELEKILKEIPEFESFIKLFQEHGYRKLYQHVMEMSRQEVNKLLLPLVQRAIENKRSGKLTKQEPGWWTAKLYEGKDIAGEIDRGIFSVYFFNIVKVDPGEAVFQGAGVPHAYLEGQNAELMANSDNVLRGGLTPKHIDVPELMKHIIFEGTTPHIMKGDEISKGVRNYPCPVPDFGIDKIELKTGDVFEAAANSMEIIAVINGSMKIAGTNTEQVKRGEAVAVLSGERYTIHANEHTLAYKAFVP